MKQELFVQMRQLRKSKAGRPARIRVSGTKRPRVENVDAPS